MDKGNIWVWSTIQTKRKQNGSKKGKFWVISKTKPVSKREVSNK